MAAPAMALVVAVGLGACSATPAEEEPTTLRIGLAASQISFDPGGMTGAWSTHASAVYDYLWTLPEGLGSQAGDFTPSVAKEWAYSEGNTVLTIQLRDDVTFTDGTPLDAEAVKANIDYVRDPEMLGAPLFVMIDDVVITGDYSLEVRLSRPSVQLALALGGGMPLVNPAALDDPDTLAETPAGSGPYLLDDYAVDASASFVRNPDYWNPDNFPYDRVEMSLLADGTARVNALKSGQVDFAGVDSGTAAEVEASGLSTLSANVLWAGLIFGDRRGEISPPIGDVRVRQAISMAMDRVGFTEATTGEYGDASNQIGVEGQTGFYLPDRADEYAYDIEGAKALLAEAGYPDGFDIDIPETAAFAAYQPYYKQAFQDLGIRVNWVQVSADAWLTEYSSGKYAVLPFVAFYSDSTLLEPEGIWNPWHNTDAADLLQTIAAGTADEAADARVELSTKILDEAWFAVLSHVPTIVAFTSDLDVVANGYGLVLLEGIRPAA
jgi:peptide/nickel transport system substrate-binding protein